MNRRMTYYDDNEIDHVLVGCKFYEMLLVPKERLFEVCRFKEGSDKRLIEKKDYEWYPMSGGLDTWLQSYALLHGRGWGIIGELSEPIKISGIYYLEL